MNPDQLDLARRLAAHPRFDWLRGMAAIESPPPPSTNCQPGDTAWRILDESPDLVAVTSELDIHEAPHMPSAFAMAIPDLTDAATGGVLLDMLRPGHLEYFPEEHVWLTRKKSVLNVPYHAGKTLAEACARALLAEWGGE